LTKNVRLCNSLAMNFSSNASLIMALSAMAGAVQVLAPDHWLPLSVLAWQRGWTLVRSLVAAIFSLTLHLAAGVGVFFCLEKILLALESSRLFTFSLVLVFGVLVLRVVRFSRINEVIRTGPASAWAFVSILSLLGPCEAIVPILAKGKLLGMGYLPVIIAFGAGTLLAGSVAVVLGRMAWNKPLYLPRGVQLGYRGTALVPLAAGLAVGLSVILRVGA
jgi:hypothetical protein